MAFTPLNALNAFLAVARRKSFASAAKDLRVSTSSLSQSVRQLEARLGVALLARTSRSVALTDAGQRLLADAGPAIDQALQSLKAVTARPGEVSGRVGITVPHAAVPLILERLLPRFVERYPKVEVEVCADDHFVDIVAEGYDAGIRLVEAIDRDMVHVRLMSEFRLVVVGAPSYLERRGVPQTPEGLLQHDCICVRWSKSSETWVWEFERGKRNWRVPVRGPVTTNDSTLTLKLARAGVGLLYLLKPWAVGVRDLERDAVACGVMAEPYIEHSAELHRVFPRLKREPGATGFEIGHGFSVLGCDFGYSEKASSDPSALVLVGSSRPALGMRPPRHIMQVISGRWGLDEIVRRIVDTCTTSKAIAAIESNAGGEYIAQQVEKTRVPVVRMPTTASSKKLRVDMLTSELNEGRWILNQPGFMPPEAAALVKELHELSYEDHFGDRAMALLLAVEAIRKHEIRPKGRCFDASFLMRR